MTSLDPTYYWLCQTGKNEGEPHTWSYPARGTYRCTHCLVVVTKQALKENTDA